MKGLQQEMVYCFDTPVSKSCAVAKSEIFWQATGQSNLVDRMEDCSIDQSVIV